MGRTPEGGRFPLVVVAVSPITGARRLLDLRGIDRPASVAPQPRPAQVIIPVDDATDERANEPIIEPPAATTIPLTAARTDEPTALRSREDLVRVLLAAGWGVTQIRDTLKGTNSEIGALVREIEDEQLHQGRS
jgi:hypothetical protein